MLQSGSFKKNDKILGITGGVGAGKSTILSYLKEAYGAVVIEADAVGHQVQQPGEPCFKEIVDVFGTEILNKSGAIDRGKLGAIVYADRKKMNQLNAIVHPAIKKRILEEIDCMADLSSNDLPSKSNLSEGFQSEDPQPGDKSRKLVVIEAALLLEDHYDEFCEEVWYIYADEQTRMKRLMSSRGYSREKVLQIMGNQLSEDEFRRRCDAVIDNSGTDVRMTYTEIDRMLREKNERKEFCDFKKG